MCGILFFSLHHTCTATWQPQRVASLWGVHRWIKRSRLKPQAVQPHLIPLNKVPVRHSREHLSKSIIYSSSLLHYTSMMERTALFCDALTFTPAYNSWQWMEKNNDVMKLCWEFNVVKNPQHPNYWKLQVRPAILVLHSLPNVKQLSEVAEAAKQNCARETVKLQELLQFSKVMCESVLVHPDETWGDCRSLNLHFCSHQYQ